MINIRKINILNIGGNIEVHQSKVIAEAYFHINNGGVTIAIEENERGEPCLSIVANHMGAYN